jgi:hypothetical protein
MKRAANVSALFLVFVATGCDSGTPGTMTPPTGMPSETGSPIITGSVAGSVAIFNTVASLKATAASNLDPKSIYFLRGYFATDDTSEGRLIWDAASTAAEDCIFVFKRGSNVCPTVAAPGGPAGRFIRLEAGTFDARKGGLKMDGTAGQFARLSLIYSAATNRAGIDKLWLGPGTLDVSDGGALTAGTAAGFAGNGASKSIGIVGAGRLATRLVGRPHGQFAQQFGIFSQLQEQETAPYLSHSWTQDLSNGAGSTTFTGVTNVGTLAVGDWVFCRLGADPTDQGEEYERLITQITSISGSDVTVSNPVREVIPNVTPSLNVSRQWDKHDMVKITALFNGFEMSDLSLDNVIVSSNTTIGTYIHDVHVPFGTAAFSNVQDENTVIERVTADLITGVNNYGWFYQGWGHVNTVVRDVVVHKLTVPFFSHESQSRSMNLDNIQVNIDSLGGPAVFVSANVGGSEGPHFGNVSLTGRGSAMFEPHTTVANLSIRGSDTVDPYLDVFIQAWQITDSLFIKGRSYSQIKKGPTMLIPLGPSGTFVTSYPLRGIPRRVRIRPSTFAGVTDILQGVTGGIETSIKPYLVAGQFSEPNHCTQLGVNFPGGGVGDRQYLKITTDASIPAGAYVEVESEFWLSDNSLATQPSEKIAGSGAPTMSAEFISQEYYDVTNRKFYTAISAGAGAADWTLSGP